MRYLSCVDDYEMGFPVYPVADEKKDSCGKLLLKLLNKCVDGLHQKLVIIFRYFSLIVCF